jgi:hypothetical protein
MSCSDTDHDTAAFAVQTIRSWWHAVGAKRYPGWRISAVFCPIPHAIPSQCPGIAPPVGE